MNNVTFLNANKIDFDNRLDFSEFEQFQSFKRFKESGHDEIFERSHGRDVIITKELHLSEALIMELPKSVKMICEAGTGFNNIDTHAARSRDIAVCNVPCYSSTAVAHLVISFILNLSTSMARVQMKGENISRVLAPHFEVSGKTLGIIGASGATGQQLVPVARSLGMAVIGHTRHLSSGFVDGVRYTTQDELLKESDFVALLCPLTSETHHLFDRACFQKMKRTAYIINTARGAIIKEDDLIDALRAEEIAGAALDVQEVEPPVPENPLLKMSNVILTPHIGWQSYESRQRLIEVTAANILSAAKGNYMNVVN